MGAKRLTWDILVKSSPVMILMIPLFSSFLIALLGRFFKKPVKFLFISALTLTLVFVGVMAYEVLMTESWVYVFGSEDPFHLNHSSLFRIVFVADEFAVLSTISISIIIFILGFYSFGHMGKEADLRKYYILFLLTWVGINGMVLTGDIFNMFVWFEVTTLASCGLIAFYNYNRKSIEASLKYLLLSVVGGLFFLFSIGLLYGQYGVLNITLLSESITGSVNDKIAVGLIITVFATKSSSVPFHLWVPGVYGDSPGPVGPFMAITSIGFLFALIRLLFTGFVGSISPLATGLVLLTLGSLSMIVSVMMAFAQEDLKKLVAYLSISQIGYMMFVIGIGFTTLETSGYDGLGSLAMNGGLFHMMNDAIYKSLLFLSIITIVYTTGIRDKNKLSGLIYRMPYTSFFFILGALSTAGIPPLSGFYSKFIIYKSAFSFHPLMGLFATSISIFILVVMARLFSNIFLGDGNDVEREKVPTIMLITMGVLACIVVVFSLFPHVIISEIIVPAVESLT